MRGTRWWRRSWLGMGLLMAAGVAASSDSASAAERVALVIGNGAYRHAPPLPNPPNDARAVASALKGIGFEVVEGTDLDIEGMRARIGAFEQALARGDARVGLVFYAGHGMQVDGENYLIPVDAELETSSDLKFRTVAATWLLDEVLGGAGSEGRVSVVMLDACRDNPLTRSFAKRTRSATGSGLADITAAEGAYIAFATAPGNVAEDGAGANSPFTTAILRNIARPGVEINSMMNAVRGEVYAQTGKRQRPYATSALLGDFYFVPATPAAQGTAAVSPPPPSPPVVTAALPPATPRQPSAEDLRLSALLRVENALLPTEGARREVQAALRALGHDTGGGRPDGRFGTGTRDALRDFQATARLEPTGHVDRATLDALRRQTARLREESAPPPPAAAATAAPPAAETPTPPSPPPQQAARSLPPTTMGVCRLPRDRGWTGERQLMYAQCAKLGGVFTPSDG